MQRLECKSFILIVGLVLGPGMASAQAEGILEREGSRFVVRTAKLLGAAKGGTLYLEASLGSVKVVAWDRQAVRVIVRKSAEVFTEPEAAAVFKDFRVLSLEEGRDTRIRAGSLSGHGMTSLRVGFEITVPAVYHLNINTAGGEVEIGDMQGNAKVRTAWGQIKLGRITGGSVDIYTSGGNISIQRAGHSITALTDGGGIQIGESGGDLSAETAGGPISVGRAEGRIALKTAGGNIRIGPTSGSVQAETAGGTIAIEQTRGAVQAETAGGSIEVDGSGGPVKVETAGGNIKVVSARGSIDAKTAGGGIEAELVVSDPKIDTHCNLAAVGGDILLRIPDDLAATIVAELDSDRMFTRTYLIYSDFLLVIRKEGGGRIVGRGELNGGGHPIRLSAVNGDIHIRKLERAAPIDSLLRTAPPAKTKGKGQSLLQGKIDSLVAVAHLRLAGGDTARVLSIWEEIGQIDPDHTVRPMEINLLPVVATALLGEKKAQDAERIFRQYLELVTPEERAIYDDISLVGTPQEVDEFRKTSKDKLGEFLDRFWTKSSLDSPQTVNLPRLEHYHRVWVARTEFSDRHKPWDRRGEVYIRYGQPYFRQRSAEPDYLGAVDRRVQSVRLRQAFQLFGGADVSLGTGAQGLDLGFITGPVYPLASSAMGYTIVGAGGTSFVPWESWVYPDIQGGIELVFTDDTWGTGYEFAPIPHVSFVAPDRIRRISSEQVFRALKATAPALYRP